jgi:hypothetical protein
MVEDGTREREDVSSCPASCVGSSCPYFLLFALGFILIAFCRGSDSSNNKAFFAVYPFPSVLCQVLHSTKLLLSVLMCLPSALGT